MPRPDALVADLPWREGGEWYHCGPAVASAQGWKLYVSATLLTLADTLERTVPLLAEAGVPFKYVRDLDLLRRLNAGTFGYSQVGKCLVIYLETVDRGLVERIAAAVEPLRSTAPRVPFARPFADGLPLAYRYGSYRGSTLEVEGTRREDARSDADAAVPEGVRDELAELAGRPREDRDLRSFLLRYPAFEAIRQQGKFGIFRGFRMDADHFSEVAVKLGYPRGQMQADGRDGCEFLRRELRFYRALAEHGLEALAPRLVDSYDRDGRVVLVLEWIDGRPLLSDLLAGTLSPGHLDLCWAILRRLHRHGLFLGDAKVANFLLHDGGAEGDDRVLALDFETAGVVDRDPVLPIRTFRVDGVGDADLRAHDRLHFLASLLFDYSSGRYEEEDRRVDLAAHLAAPPATPWGEWAVQRLREERSEAA